MKSNKDLKESLPKSYYGYMKELSDDNSRIPKLFQQWVDEGFDDSETWSFDSTLQSFIYPRLRRLVEIQKEYIVLDKDYEEALEVMLDGFELAASEDYDNWDEEQYSKVHSAYEALAKYHNRLWW